MSNRKEILEQNKQTEIKADNQAEQEKNIETSEEQVEQSPVEAPAIKIDKKSEKVIVCLKHSQGIKFKLADGSSVTIDGNATHLKGLKTGIIPDGGFGMTKVKREDWDYIKKTYSSMQVFKSGLIFASADSESASSQAKEHDEIQSGLEPVVIGENTNVKELKKIKNYKKEDM